MKVPVSFENQHYTHILRPRVRALMAKMQKCLDEISAYAACVRKHFDSDSLDKNYCFNEFQQLKNCISNKVV